MPYSITETGEILISKDSRILKSFIIKMSQRTNSRDFIKGAVIAAGTENYLEQMIDYMDSHPEASFSEVMCFLYRIQGIIKE